MAGKKPYIIDTMGSWTARRPTATEPGKNFIETALAHGVTALAETVVADVDLYDLHTVLRYFDDFHWLLNRYADKAMLVRTADDLETAHQTGKLGLIAMLQGANSIFEDLAILRILYGLGLRSMSLTYMRGNALGSGCQELTDNGLTVFGQKVIREMNRLGVAVDLSHVGQKTALDAIRYSGVPVLFTHSNVRGVTEHPRNIGDHLLQALKENGGYIALTPVSVFCRTGKDRPNLDDFIAHIQYTADVVGIEHVGIATDRLISDVFDEQMILSKTSPELLDFSVAGKHVRGVDGFGFWESMTNRLQEKGFSKEEVEMLLGKNYLRIIRQIWKS